MGRFVDNGDGTVTDNQTGLVWSREVSPPLPWKEAMAFATMNRLGLPGDGWRAPTYHEMVGLVDLTRSQAPYWPEAFGDEGEWWQWTSTPVPWSSSYAFYVIFVFGYVYDFDISSNGGVRCVRAGP